jgi:hypothetical protein
MNTFKQMAIDILIPSLEGMINEVKNLRIKSDEYNLYKTLIITSLGYLEHKNEEKGIEK